MLRCKRANKDGEMICNREKTTNSRIRILQNVTFSSHLIHSTNSKYNRGINYIKRNI